MQEELWNHRKSVYVRISAPT